MVEEVSVSGETALGTVESEGIINFPTLLVITINSILGTGVFFLPAVGARVAGPASLISWLIMGFYAMAMASVFAELSGMFAFGGGVYEYCKQAFGSFFSFIVGWMTLLSSYITIAMLVVGAITYIFPVIGNISLFGNELPANLVIILMSLFFIIAFNIVAFLGMKTGAVMLVTFGLITLTTLFALIFPAWSSGFHMPSFQPFISLGIPSIFLAIFFISETFFGWESVCFFSPQVKNGRKNVPKALMIGTFLIVVVAFVYVVSVMNGVGASVLGSPEFVATPISLLGDAFYGGHGYDIFTILCYVAIIGSVAGWIVATPDLVRTLGADKIFPSQLADLHPKFGTPYKAIIFQTILISLFTFMGAGQYEKLLHMLLPMVLIMYSFVVLALLVLRKTKPEQDRTFRMPFAFPVGIFLILFNLSIVGFWIFSDPHEAISVIALASSFVLVGIPIYFLMTMYYNPDAIKKVHDLTAFLNLLTESFFIPRRIIKEILLLLGNIRDKNVLEYGCGVGTLTKQIARQVSKQKKVYITSMSKNELNITHKRLKRKGDHEHVVFIHDEHHISRIHPDVGQVDIVVSFGMLSYMQDVNKILTDIDRVTTVGATVCFVDYVDYFKIFPNTKWLAKLEEAEDLFRRAGFSIQVKKIKGILWNYIFIYGVKTGLKGDQSVPTI